MVEVVYTLPTWAVGIAIVAITSGFAVTGLALVNRFMPPGVREHHNNVANPITNIVAVVYAVMLAFLVIAVWQDFGKADDIAQREASSVSDVYRAARAYPEPLQRRVRTGLEDYVRLVVSEEWTTQAEGRPSERSWAALEGVYKDMIDFDPKTPREQIVHTEQLREFNELLDYRRARLTMAVSGLQPVIWVVVLAGTALVIAFSWFFGTGNVRAHYGMSALMGVAIGLVLFLIAILDYPFRGGVSISPAAFEQVQENFKRLATTRR
ncbi:MAG TPA: DUF4239 domain-containing protein [Methylomirabilota bacterium]|jgi:hypothetical protein|nr:DUF4239 domain-containing protein [Methylomirabilota bacterium]